MDRKHMTPDERLLLSNFLRDLTQARGGPKDPEAETMITQALSSNPDGAYLLVQHAVMSDQALHAAQARIAALEAQQRGPGQGSSFLGGGAPASGPNVWNQGPSTSVPPSYPPPSYGQAPPYQPPPQYPPQPSAFSSGGGLGSFLRSAGTMAAGVAGGELLFGGLSSMFGGHGGGGMFGGGGNWGGGGETIENVTVNEYDDGGGSYDQGGFDGGDDWSDDGN